MLYDLTLRSDSVIGMGSTVVVPAAFARRDVREMRSVWPERSTSVKLRDGAVYILQSVKLTRDSVTGFSPGPSTRIAIARRDIDKLEEHGPQTGKTLGAMLAVVLLTAVLGIVALSSIDLGG